MSRTGDQGLSLHLGPSVRASVKKAEEASNERLDEHLNFNKQKEVVFSSLLKPPLSKQDHRGSH